MAVIPQDKQWKQPNDGDSLGNVFSTWGIDFDENRGSVSVSNPIKNVFDTSDDADLDSYVADFVDHDSKFWAIADNPFKSAVTSTDLTDGTNWAQDTDSGTPTVSNSTTDSVLFDGKLLVVDGDDIVAHNGTEWSSWWQGTLVQAALLDGEDYILTVGSDGNLYIVDDGNLVYRVNKSNLAVSKTGAGTLDFSATPYLLKNAVTTSTRTFYGTEDTKGNNAVIIEWDLGTQSISANRIHEMGVKRILVQAVWNDTPIAILSDGSIKYFNGTSYVNWEGAKLPKTKDNYLGDVIHKNGWDILDGLPHFLINPTVDINDISITEDTSNYWNYHAGVYCLDPKVGLYLRYSLTDSTNKHLSVDKVGALHARKDDTTKFFASYELWSNETTRTTHIVAEDITNASSTEGWLLLQPVESVKNLLKKLTLVHKRMGSGDSIDVYYRRHDDDAVRVSGNWLNTTQFNTTDSVSGIERGFVSLSKVGTSGGFFSTVKTITSGTTSEVVFNDPASVTANDYGVLEFINYKHMGTITNTGVEVSDFTIPQPQRSRQVWVWLKLNQAAGNDLQLDYLLTE